MHLETLSKDLFIGLEVEEAAGILGGMLDQAAAPGFHNSYTFFNDGTYVTDDKDQDAA